ncbi:hypothetical protein AVEN_84804-1 [Araneus ventricosus]|uniref:Uncharacterized protein n=1 Tax=Araneus ventricosus TaxID=182803 RepID=A0A4Y2WXL4_ARAVE|nr:hypothetical protein AVEN_84804-1 [Araneus ventricosus]
MAKEEDIFGIKIIEGSNFYTVKFRRNDRVQRLSLMSNAIKVHNESVSNNSTTLFQRISITKQSDEELEDFLKYEQCPFPLPVFDEDGMRKARNPLHTKLSSHVHSILMLKAVYILLIEAAYCIESSGVELFHQFVIFM